MTGLDRRHFLSATATAFAALASGCRETGGVGPITAPYGPLVPDPAGLLDLPAGFSYRVLSSLGDAMDDGGRVPDAADGMGCFDLGGGRLALVRNHELKFGEESGGALSKAYDAAPGGTTTIVLDAATLAVERQFRSLSGTIRNCAGGTTPWGSWLSCEEDVTAAGGLAGKDHGYVFEVPAAATGPVDPVPLKAMGRFNHEAACVDPATGFVYLTEDRDDGLLYRFVPDHPGQLASGELHALAPADGHAAAEPGPGKPLPVRWIKLEEVDLPGDDLRRRGAAIGALTFRRGEGIHMGEGELYFVCTSGGAAGLGQVFRLRFGDDEVDRLELFFESTAPDQFNFGDNLTVAPSGHLIVCEDQYEDPVDNHLRGITPEGQPYALARVRVQTEPAGPCFSPDGRVLFVNLYSPTRTLAITGPWAHLRT
jgi:secreted PhoX family phosphatase